MPQKNNSNAKQSSRRSRASKTSGTVKTIPKVRGQGGYWTDKIVPYLSDKVPPGTLSMIARSIGSASGVPGGGDVASYLGNRLAKVVGFGDYEVVANTLSTKGGAIPEGVDIPSFSNTAHETRICHREYIKDIVVPDVPTDFTLQSWNINPGNADMFPWLAAIAARYQQYKINGCLIEFKTLSSDITAGGALGAVILATNYDVVENVFANKLEMENSQYAVSAKPSRSQVHAIECDPQLTTTSVLYVRGSNEAGSTVVNDPRFYDLGRFQLATVGLPGAAGAVLGELWITYDITLLKPIIAHPAIEGTSNLLANDTIGTTSPLGYSPILTGNDMFSVVDEFTIRMHVPGIYYVQCSYQGTALDVLTVVTNAGFVTPLQDLVLVAGTSRLTNFVVDCRGPGTPNAGITITFTTGAVAFTFLQFWMTKSSNLVQ